jgi:hypothetical protein
MQRIQHLTFDENEVWSLSNNVLAFTLAQSNLTFTYNNYYTENNNPCKAYFSRDVDSNGTTETVDTTFNEYGRETGLDTTSFLGGVAYNRHGCGTTGASVTTAPVTGLSASLDTDGDGIRIYPDPVVHKLSVTLTQAAAGAVRLELWDLSGRPIVRKDVVAAPGTTELGWEDVKQTGVTPGTYILRVIGASKTYMRKIIVL